jgi:thiamine pyrophosphate-dependent acetolactate synthase large subunit-like protein
MSEMSSIGRKEWPRITMVIFRNYQWGAEKRNSILWFDDNFVGTELDPELSYARVAEGCSLKGVTVRTRPELTNALKIACEAKNKGITTFIEVILNQELGEPFRRDATSPRRRVKSRVFTYRICANVCHPLSAVSHHIGTTDREKLDGDAAFWKRKVG